MRLEFQSMLVRPKGVGTWTYLDVPAEVSAALGSRGQIQVKGVIDGSAFRSTLMPDGEGGHYLVVNKALRDKIGKQAGDAVAVELEQDDAPRELNVPDDFQAALSLIEQAAENFEKLSQSHKNRWLDHIAEAKTPEARMRRIEKVVLAIGGKSS